MRKLWCFFCILFAASCLYGADYQQEPSIQELTAPNPLDLQPNWLAYFEVASGDLEKRIVDEKAFLESFYSQLEKPEEIQEAEKRTKQFLSHLDSLAFLKKQETKRPVLAWLPKESYSLDDYIKISDHIRDLKLDIKYKNTELNRFKYSANNYDRNLKNAYAKYLTIPQNTKEKLLQGLEVMVLGARLLYLEAEVQLARDMIGVDTQELARYQDERSQIDDKLQVEVNLEKVNEETENIRQELADAHQELLGLESQSVKAYVAENGGEQSRLSSQRLTGVLIKEALLKAQLFLNEAKLTLHTALTHPEQIDYDKDIAPIQSFRKNIHDQLPSWQEIIAAEIDLLSQALIKVNGDGQSVSNEESLKMALSNKALLDALANVLFHIRLVIELTDQHALKEQTIFNQTAHHFQNFWYGFTESFGAWFYYSLFDIGGVPITLAGLFKAALIILVAIWLSNFSGRALKRFGKGKGQIIEPTLYTFRRIIHYLILLVGILFALASVGLTMRNMAIVLGAVGIGVGLGLQNIVNNFLCGLAILFERNVKIGDYVELESGFLGKITEVNVQNTTLHTFDGVDVLVPNSSLISNHVVNWTKRDPYQRLHVPFGVAYGSDQAQVSKVVCESALNVSYTMRASQGVNDPEVWLVAFGESSLNFELVVWVNIFKSRGRRAMTAEYLGKIELALKEHGIHIPFPQRDLHLKTLPNEGIQITRQ